MRVGDLIEKYRSPHSVSLVPALAGLDEVDWAGLRDAYGPATEVPALFRAFASIDPNDREYALQLLFQTIWHQGNVYSATVEAIPFLYNLLEGDGPHDRDGAAGLIAAIADGQPPFIHCVDDPEQYAF